MEDQTIRLGLKVEGREDVETLRRAHAALKGDVIELGDSYEVLTSDLETATKQLETLGAAAAKIAAENEKAALTAQRLAEAEAEAARAAALEAESLAKAAHAAAELAALTELATGSTRQANVQVTAFAHSAAELGDTIHLVGESYELLAQDELELFTSMTAANGTMIRRAGVLREILESDRLVETQTTNTAAAVNKSGQAVQGNTGHLRGQNM